MPTRQDIEKAFAVFDADGNGTLSADELKRILTMQVKGKPGALTADDVDKLIRRFDANGDGVLSIDEFAKAFEGNALSLDGGQVSLEMAAIAAAAEAVAAMPPYKDDPSEAAWRKYQGEALEPMLRVDEELGGSAVQLIDARFLVELASRGGRLCRRQDAPKAAFLSLDQLKRLPKGGKSGDCLRIVSISQ